MTVAATTLALAACTNNDSTPEAAEVQAVFITNLDTRAQTRMANAEWEENDAIGIFSLSDEFEGVQGTTPNLAVNTKYTRTTGTGGAGWVSDNAFRFKNPVATVVKFKAYYPYTEDDKITAAPNLKNGNIAVDASTQTADVQKEFDFLFADKAQDGTDSQGSKANPQVSFQFAHSMAKVIIILKPDTDKGVTYDDVKAMVPTLNGLLATGTFKLEDGTVTATGDAIPLQLGNATEDNAANTKTFTAIVPPQAAPASASLSIEQSAVGTYLSTQILSGQALEAGKSYQYTITVKKLELIVNASDITDWIVGVGDGQGDAVLQ